MAHPVTRPRSRGAQGAPPDGPGAIDLVPADRSQSSEIRAQHLSGDGGGFRHGDPARLLLPGAGLTPGAARGAVTRTAQRSALRRPIFSSASVGAGPPTATMTRFRPPVVAWYIAASALAISSSGVSPLAGYSAAPMLTDILPPWNASPATRARMRSATVAAIAIGASINITTNSSPP